jgi:hypothetical protein
VENTIISLREVVVQVTDTMWKTPSGVDHLPNHLS